MIIGLPRFGIYSNIAKSFIEGLGHKVIMPTKVTRSMIQLGASHSSDMICFPYKVALGQQIWALENGATDLIMWNNCGICRQKHYPELEEITLKELGYKFNIHIITKKTIRKMLKQLGGISIFQAIKRLKGIYKQVKEIEEKAYAFSNDNRTLKIGLVGEVYTMWEHDINFDIVKKLQGKGVNVDVSITLSDFLTHNVIKGKEEEKEAKKLLSQDLGGHGFESIVNTIWYGKNNYDGIIHLLPLSCMPESTVEVLIDQMATKYDIPLYRFPIDESNFEAGFNTRLETFVGMLKRRKK